jgi:hypothetical protein
MTTDITRVPNRTFPAKSAMPSIRDAFNERGVKVVAVTPEVFGDFIKAEVRKWTDVAKESGIQVE